MQKINIDQRVIAAQALFKSGYNCAQSVFLAYSDLFELDQHLAATISGSFGGGMGRLREVCGTVSAMALIAGFLRPATDPKNQAERSANYALVQACAEQFRAINGAIVCRELLGLTQRTDPPVPALRTDEYYRKRPCVEYVADAARIIGEKINAEAEG
ncbi:MAG: C-GCAxxG-C-C family protein [Alistipes sp.]